MRATPSRHNTATRLGAKPSGFIYPLAFNQTTHNADADAARVIIESDKANNFDARAFRRAWGPLTIVPTEKQALTIPIHAISYGRPVAQLPAKFKPLFRPKNKQGKKMNILAATINGVMTPLYALVKKVTIPQDPGLLPTEAELTQTAASKIVGFLRKRGASDE